MVNLSDILNARILIVDDLPVNVAVLEQMLGGAGYTNVTSTHRPEDVYELHLAHRYSLILLDLQMPGMDGFQVMEQLKTLEEDYIPVLVQTSQPSHRLQALRAGAKDFVSKPLDLAEVLLRVRNLIEVRLLNENAKMRMEQAEQAKEEMRAAQDKITMLNLTLEDRVAERTAQLESANKELKAFSYSVSHDLRAPLRHVVGFVSLLQASLGASLSQGDEHLLKTISEAAKRMGTLIDDLLAFSQVGQTALEKRDVNLDQLVQDILKDIESGTDQREIDWKIHPLPHVQADPALLRMVLTNLIENAVKFTANRHPAAIEIGSEGEKAGEIITFVRDNGAGFNPKYTEKLFGVFQRLHSREEFEGTGIGLANVQRIVHRHGGRAWATGEVDRGATFYFSIPDKLAA